METWCLFFEGGTITFDISKYQKDNKFLFELIQWVEILLENICSRMHWNDEDSQSFYRLKITVVGYVSVQLLAYYVTKDFVALQLI